MFRPIYNKQIKDFVKENVKGLSNKELTELVNKTFDKDFTTTQIQSLKARLKVKSGVNSGKIPAAPIGSINIGSRNNLTIRCADGEWRNVGILVWEKFHGSMPKGHVIMFKDGNACNCHPDNLIAITKMEHIHMHAKFKDKCTDPEINMARLNSVKLKLAIRQKKERKQTKVIRRTGTGFIEKDNECIESK